MRAGHRKRPGVQRKHNGCAKLPPYSSTELTAARIGSEDWQRGPVWDIPRPPRSCPAPPCVSIAKASKAAHSTSSTLRVVRVCSAASGATPLLRLRLLRVRKPLTQAACSSRLLELKPPTPDPRSRRSRDSSKPLDLKPRRFGAKARSACATEQLGEGCGVRKPRFDTPDLIRRHFCIVVIAEKPRSRAKPRRTPLYGGSELGHHNYDLR